MIYMNDWHIEVPSDQRVLAQTGDNLSYRIEIQCEPIDDSLSYKLDVENKYHEKDIIDLNRSGSILWATIRKDYLIINGTVRLQVRGINGAIVRHSNTFLMEVGYSIDGPSYFSDSDLSEFEQIEARITELKEETIRYVEDAKAAAALAVTTPYIGDNGNWYVYSHADKKYVDSGYPSSRKGDQGIQGPRGETGQDGRSFTLKAMYPTYEDMTKAHPIGTAGDAYCIGTKDDNEVWFWNEEKNAWKNIGSMKGDQGEIGSQGIQGIQGIPGENATISIGAVQSVPAGENAEVSNVGTPTNAVLSFKIPVGDTGETGEKGDAATVTIGTITTVGSYEQAEVINTGTTHDAVLNFKIPKGATGNDGKSFAIKGRFDTLEMLMEAHPNGAAGDAYLVGVGDDSYLYVWNEDIAFWDNMGHFQIAKGDPGISPTVSIASTTTGEPGTAAIVQNIGTDQNVKLAFTIPAGNTGATGSQGPAGKAATIKIGEVITGETGTQASVVNTGTETDAVLRVTLPRGERGQTGNTGETGERGISIANAQVNADYHLIVTLSTGETIDAGYVRGATGSTGATGAQGPKGDTPTSIPASGVTGGMTIQQGGTGNTTAGKALDALINGSSAITSTSLSDSDYVAILDISDSTGKKLTIGDLKTVIGASVSGGTASTADKLTTPRTIRTNLSSTSTASFDGSANVTPGVTGTLGISNGGTNATTGAKGLYNLVNPASVLTTLADDDYIGVVDTSAATGKKITVANLKSVIGSTGGGTSGDYLPITGGTLTGDLRIQGSRNYGTKINLGDSEYVYISEPTDDCLEIKGDKQINLVTSKLLLNGSAFPTGGSGSSITTPVSIANGGTGSTTASEAMYELISGSTTTTSISDSAYIPFYTGSSGRKITFANLKSALGTSSGGSTISTPVSIANGGTGGTTATAGIKNLISGLSAATTLSTSDYIPFGNSSTSSKITLANLKAALGVTSGGSSSTTESHKIATGTYIGDGSSNGNYKKITLGFRPSFVFVCSLKANSPIAIDGNSDISFIYFGSAYTGVPSEQNEATLEINGLGSSGGFTVSNSEYNGSDGHVYQYLNHNGKTYAYFAVE